MTNKQTNGLTELFLKSLLRLKTQFINIVILYGDLSYLEIYEAPMHSGSYKDCTTELYFLGWMSIFKIKFSLALVQIVPKKVPVREAFKK